MADTNRITAPLPPAAPALVATFHIGKARLLVDILAEKNRLTFQSLETTLRVVSNELAMAQEALRPTAVRSPIISGSAFGGAR
jgi:hypothetical protein